MEHRVCITLPQGLSAHLQQLEQRTHAWFSAQPVACAEDMFIKYYYESRRGSLKPLYATLIQHAREQHIVIQSAITDCLTRAVSASIQAPGRAVRLVLGILTYWLSQYHCGQHRELPEPREARDIIAGILQDTVISVG
ncbi:MULTISPECIES: hypothetical protein [Kluyvera]|uniref:hypothetical protein n=1 Tax=Kluyvera sp. CHPC 1.2972 TaxID=2995176 RepID=UPI002FD7E0E2